MKSTLFLCGAGNAEGVRLALRINEKQKNWEKIVICDDDLEKKGDKILGVEIIGPFELLRNADPDTMEVVNLVARTTIKRQLAYEKIKNYEIPFISLIDESVEMMGVEYKNDVIIYPNVTFSAGAFIDQGSVVFTGAVIGHGCTVGKFCVIAPGAVLNARIVLEDRVYIGTNASILPDLKIGAGATIGLNSGVIENVPSGATAMGVPAELIFVPKSQTDIRLKDKASTDFCKDSVNIEKTITNIWKQVLNIEAIGRNDNFFDIGGHSVLAVQLYEKVKQVLQNKITLIDIFHYPTISSFVNFLEMKNSVVSEITLSADSKHATLFRQRLAQSKARGRGNTTNLNTQEID